MNEEHQPPVAMSISEFNALFDVIHDIAARGAPKDAKKFRISVATLCVVAMVDELKRRGLVEGGPRLSDKAEPAGPGLRKLAEIIPTELIEAITRAHSTPRSGRP